jgi:hypothetical protein
MFKRRTNDKTYFPIIPDLNYIKDKEVGHTNPYHYTVKEFPKLKANYFSKIKPALKNRINKILTYEINKRFKGKWLMRNALKLVKGLVAKKITAKAISIMKKDFENRSMF